ncbi:unnamed protein product, partial [Adineta ricciae]
MNHTDNEQIVNEQNTIIVKPEIIINETTVNINQKPRKSHDLSYIS